ncbi:Putative protein of unknown function [Podospora comata]|uniref:Uncharacterized protein n=1 Tax=Podospora comata TaxID=48703 RepID=A0ABY6SEX5_PODCO|nr:Putative protein of unknown function [Podospora comata]
MYGSLDIQSLVLLPSLPPYTIHLLTLQQHLTTLRYTIFPGSFIRVVNPHQDHHPYSYYGAMEHPCSPGPKHPSYSRSSTPKMPSTKRKSPWLGRQCRHPPPQAVDRLNQRLDHSDNSLYTLLHQRANAKTTSTTFITPISPIIFTHPHPTLPHNPTNQPPKCSSPSPPSSPSSQRPSPPQPGRSSATPTAESATTRSRTASSAAAPSTTPASPSASPCRACLAPTTPETEPPPRPAAAISPSSPSATAPERTASSTVTGAALAARFGGTASTAALPLAIAPPLDPTGAAPVKGWSMF